MKRKKMHSIQLSAFMLVAALGAPSHVASQDAKQPYATMAPVEQYLMDRDGDGVWSGAAGEGNFCHASLTGNRQRNGQAENSHTATVNCSIMWPRSHIVRFWARGAFLFQF